MQIPAAQRAIVAALLLERIDHRGIALQQHAFPQAIFKHAGNQWALFRFRRFAFDQRSQAANFPLFIPQMMVPLGYSLMGLLVAVRLLTRSRRGSASRAEASQ